MSGTDPAAAPRAGRTAVLVVRRPRVYMDRLRDYRIRVDGREVGRVGYGGELRVAVTPGPHVVRAEIDWCSSQPLPVECGPTPTVVAVRNRWAGWRALLLAGVVLFRRGDYLRLELVAGEEPGRSGPSG